MRMRVGNIEKCTTSQSMVSQNHIFVKGFSKDPTVAGESDQRGLYPMQTVYSCQSIPGLKPFDLLNNLTVLQFYDSTILTPSDPTLYSTAVFIAHLAKLI